MSDKRVELMIIGAMKCGTTTLASALAAHPDVAFCKNKEPDFFSKEPDLEANIVEYHSLFGDPSKLWVEASTSYTMYPNFRKGLWRELHRYNPSMKLIYLYRDPVARCISHYMHVYERGYLDMSLEEAVRRVPLIVNTSRYAAQVQPFIDQFGKDQVLLMDLEELSKERENALKRVSAFTGLEPSGFPSADSSHKNRSVGESKHHHKYDDPSFVLKALIQLTPRKYRGVVWKKLTGTGKRGFSDKPQLSPEWKEAIIRLLHADIKKFEKMTGRSLEHWFNDSKVDPDHPSDQ